MLSLSEQDSPDVYLWVESGHTRFLTSRSFGVAPQKLLAVGLLDDSVLESTAAHSSLLKLAFSTRRMQRFVQTLAALVC